MQDDAGRLWDKRVFLQPRLPSSTGSRHPGIYTYYRMGNIPLRFDWILAPMEEIGNVVEEEEEEDTWW